MGTPRSASWGSSPLTRGKRAIEGPLDARIGLIPAHAGKTAVRGDGAHERGAHPRSRGENTSPGRTSGLRHGSSPLTRGKLNTLPQEARARRLIPAHAGKTWSPRQCRAPTGAHPRSRGENVAAASRPKLVPGSSPLTRGKPSRSGAGRPRRRLIPAHAGKTVHVSSFQFT